MACYNVFLLPLDVANQQGSYVAAGGLPMPEINVAFFIASSLMIMIIIPFTVFYYEGEDDGDGAKYVRDSSQEMICTNLFLNKSKSFSNCLCFEMVDTYFNTRSYNYWFNLAFCWYCRSFSNNFIWNHDTNFRLFYGWCMF